MKIEISNEELRVIVWALENSKDLLEKKLPNSLWCNSPISSTT